MSQLILTDRIRVINLIAQNHEWDLAQLLHAQQSVELGFRFGKTLMVLGVNEEYDAGDFWEIVLPETACWTMSASSYHAEIWSRSSHTLLMSTQVECREFNVANGKFFGCWKAVNTHARACACRRICMRATHWDGE
jgi:hypothetical protein